MMWYEIRFFHAEYCFGNHGAGVDFLNVMRDLHEFFMFTLCAIGMITNMGGEDSSPEM